MKRLGLTLWRLTKQTVQAYSADNCSHMAAAISYYVLFSIIPLAFFAVAIFGLVVRDQERQDDISERIVDALDIEAGDVVIETDDRAVTERYGEEALRQIETALRPEALTQDDAQQLAATLANGGSVTVAGHTLGPEDLSIRYDNIVTESLRGVSRASAPLSVFGLIAAAWGASAMFGAIRRSLNIAWGQAQPRPLVQQKLKDLALVAGLGLLLGASVAGTGALRAFRELSDDALGPLSTGSGFFWSVLPLFLPAVFSFGVFLFLYRVVPSAPTSVRTIWPGALLATVLFELMKNGFALYIAKFGNYDPVYGSLGGILLFMTWTYLSASILLVGAELAAVYPQVLAQDDAGPSRPFAHEVRRFVVGLFIHQKKEKPASDEPTSS